ncbi:hypothetical protein DV113_004577 [Geotrichum candidum]|uniref:Uncharacterized protein n=1 Tax=Geotrichum candidum TaxID=1173061 RepID=A0A0J9XIU7_GEOCN|nr:hypothetical protein DV454_004401 [Geotrichum candidum]KAI9214466.1 hypothetical protein DS838_000685 [Geotrichum bryndzae]KAF5114341.1 hypothetical protein DV452_003351 [Geotrichum candidum]KAF7497406.1 hypothetical protein DV113_004577 [Geotrichum candidum]KAI8133884.1 hypothetical protein DUD61_002461 [Geotrichum candidum]
MFRRPSAFRTITLAGSSRRAASTAASSRADSDRIAAAFKQSTLKTKVRNPMVPLLVLVSFVSSALITVASYQQELDALRLMRETKRASLEQVIERLKRGEEFDVDNAVEQLTTTDADKTLEELMREIEESETEWMVSEPQEPKSATDATAPLPATPEPAAKPDAPTGSPESTSSSPPARPTSKFL